MNIEALLNSKLLIAVLSGVGGIIASLTVQKILNKRALFTYYVFHNQIGLSADDEVYGSIRVAWNNTPVVRLYLSTIELVNNSSKDFDSVAVRIFTNNTRLLTQRAEILDTTRIIDFTEEYKKELFVSPGGEPSEKQFDLFHHRRDYLIPTMNRGQRVRFEFLNVPESEEQPSIWVEILQKGIKCNFRIAQKLFMGVPQSTAALVGSVFGLILIMLILFYINNIWFAAMFSYIIGLIVLVPGAISVKIYRKIQSWLVG